MKKILFLSVLCLLSTATAAVACWSPIDAKKLYVVNEPGKMDLKALTGDVIRIQGTWAVVPSTSGYTASIEYDRSVLNSVGKEDLNPYTDSPGLLGAAGRVFYLKVVGAGKSNVVVTIRGADGNIVSQTNQRVEATEAPVYRCL